ncbi:MAG: agmatinase [Candidatus Omnitrophota bacterium]
MEEVILEKRFSDVASDYAGLKKAKACVIQAPYEGTLTYVKGARRGPAAIIDASANMERFDDELQTETYKIGIYTSPPLEFGISATPEKAISRVKDAVSEVLQAGKFPVVLGGEHSVTVGAVRAAKETFKELSVLYLDAHCDLRDEYGGSKYNHACTARRIHKMCPITEAGTRSLSQEEKDFLNTSPPNLKVISVHDILEMHDWKKEAARSLTDTVYITIDLDVLDPSIMPSVGTPEPGGLGWYEFMDLLKRIAKEKKVIGFDVVELSPKDGFVAPDFLAAKLVYRLLGYVFFNGRK